MEEKQKPVVEVEKLESKDPPAVLCLDIIFLFGQGAELESKSLFGLEDSTPKM